MTSRREWVAGWARRATFMMHQRAVRAFIERGMVGIEDFRPEVLGGG